MENEGNILSASDYLQIWRDWQQQEASVRHAVAVFLIIYSLVGLDIFSTKGEKARERRTLIWVVWGVSFTILGQLVIAPEQEAIQAQRRREATS